MYIFLLLSQRTPETLRLTTSTKVKARLEPGGLLMWLLIVLYFVCFFFFLCSFSDYIEYSFCIIFVRMLNWTFYSCLSFCFGKSSTIQDAELPIRDVSGAIWSTATVLLWFRGLRYGCIAPSFGAHQVSVHRRKIKLLTVVRVPMFK